MHEEMERQATFLFQKVLTEMNAVFDEIMKMDFRGRPHGFDPSQSLPVAVPRNMTVDGSRIGDSNQDELYLTTPSLHHFFSKYCRMHPAVFLYLEHKIKSLICTFSMVHWQRFRYAKSSSLPLRRRLMVTIWRLATGESFGGIGHWHRFRIHHSRANEAFHSVLPLLVQLAQAEEDNRLRYPDWRAHPAPLQCRRAFDWSGVVAAVDGTHTVASPFRWESQRTKTL